MAGEGKAVEFDTDVQEFLDLSAHARQFAPELHKQMRKNIRAAVKPALVAVRKEVLKAPSKRGLRSAKQQKVAKAAGRRTRLRQGIAAGIRVDYDDKPTARRVGVFIRATSSRLPAAQKGMQRTYNKPKFRHRVFGGDVWVEQYGHPYFEGPIREQSAQIQRAVKDAIDTAAKSIKQ